MGEGEEQGLVKIADFGLARIYQAPLKPLSENGVLISLFISFLVQLIFCRWHNITGNGITISPILKSFNAKYNVKIILHDNKKSSWLTILSFEGREKAMTPAGIRKFYTI